MTQYTLHRGDCLAVLKTMPDNSVDSIVTDPPYGLSDHKPAEVLACLSAWIAGEPYRPKGKGFMGKGWDAWVPGPEVWRECLRVLKPGGHLLAFAGTRSMDLMSMAVRLAGFELRDAIGHAHDGGGAPLMAWCYGSGFPKSLDVSKAIDKMDATETQGRRRLAFTAWVRSQGVTSRQIDEATGTNMGSHYTTSASQPAIMTREHLEACRHLFREIPQWVEQEADKRTAESENFKLRAVLGTEVRLNEPSGIVSAGRDERTLIERKITAAHTDAARQWQGWGTALKPAWEPIILARKPIDGTVAANVLAHGTGALNIDGCRVGETVETWPSSRSYSRSEPGAPTKGTQSAGAAPAGRWPANLIHDDSDEVVALFPQAPGQQGALTGAEPSSKTANAFGEFAGRSPSDPRGDTGSAARFFYCAKASKTDRGTGNVHPTVKPTDLMRYLCRLVTPPGGLVLDPFMGSGSTGKACMLEGFRFVGIDRDEGEDGKPLGYMAIAEERIAATARLAEAERQAAAESVRSQTMDLFSQHLEPMEAQA